MNTCKRENPVFEAKSEIEKTLKVNLIYTVFSVFLLLCSVFLLIFPDIPVTSVGKSLSFCAVRLIPSLFPFMVISELLMRSGFPEAFRKLFGKIFSRIFGMSSLGVSAFAVGLFSGFPAGGKSVVTLYEEGKIGKREAEILLPVCNNAGPAFVIAGIGAGMWKSSLFGICLWITSLISSVVGSKIVSLILNEKIHTLFDPKPVIYPKTSEKGFSGIFTESVTRAVQAMLNVCGFVIVFETVLGYSGKLLSGMLFGEYINVLLSVFLEIGSAGIALSGIAAKGGFIVTLARILTFGACAWGGLSAHLQIASFACSYGIKLRRYYTVKAVSFVVSVCIGSGIIFLFF